MCWSGGLGGVRNCTEDLCRVALSSTTHAVSISVPLFYQQHCKNVLGFSKGGKAQKERYSPSFGSRDDN